MGCDSLGEIKRGFDRFPIWAAVVAVTCDSLAHLVIEP